VPALIPAILRLLPQLAIAGLLLFGVWKIDRAGYRRAAAQIEAQNRAQQQRIEKLLAGQMSELDGRMTKRLESLESAARARSIIIEKEVANDPRYRDPGCALTPGVLDAVNAARRGGAAAAGADRRSMSGASGD
jgi:hypothetical protein